ncbi:MAG: HAD-IA family hydrolase [Myxococcota bacterium]|jgi:putative hydrolase of the HAD superfamily|nr:HAD-IA family hydrolase [bacterium]MDP6074647.1 HAD-IA family hydrolase [Myxococcota bacterium]MDP6241967.1 HAD-IA family hydrolase [Myxococcota bacterium]MDP7072983.1 HAD-IA family hydrolase [Myxococcota bacterium]MDP7297777.1 HAD-IA family hydrolase [Myxococcota bacterium]
MIRAVLFDAAGTLIETREPVGGVYARHARKHGVEISARRLGEAFARVFEAAPPLVFPGLGTEERGEQERGWWRARVHETFRAADSAQRPDDFEALFEGLWRHFSDPGEWKTRRDAAETLVRLRAQEIQTGVVSNFDGRLPGILGGLGLLSLLDTVVLPADAGAAKPDPRIFAMALERLAVRPEDSIFVGNDAQRDLAGARAAGLRAVDATALATLADLPLTTTGSTAP